MPECPTTSATVIVQTVHPGPLGGAIFTGKDSEGLHHRFVASFKSIFRAPVPGEIWTLEGALQSHPRYGLQIHVETSLLEKPSGRLIVDYLTKHPAFKETGVGNKKATRLWDVFGEEMYSILSDGHVAMLELVLTKDTACKLVNAWQQAAPEAEVLRFLAYYGFEPYLAAKVRRVWGPESIQKIQENPYRMMAFADFAKVDRMARALGIDGHDPRRQVAAVEACLYRRLDAKHTLTPVEDVVDQVSLILKAKDRSVARVAVHRAVRECAVLPFGGGYQPLGAAVMEKFIADRFQRMLSGSTGRQQSLFSSSLEAVVANAVRKFGRDNCFTLNSEQVAGVRMAVSHPLSVLTGGAGVGKTTVLKVIHEACEQTGTPVRQMALSGRAAQRMRETTGREASTIAKFLREAGEGKVDPCGNPLLIIDEASMLDLPLLYDVIRVLPASARLLFVGDPYQLPPISFGLIFHVLASSRNVPRVELTQVHRQSQSSGIPQIAHDIRRGIVPELPPFDGVATGVSFIRARNDEAIERLALARDLFGGCEDVQILGVTKRGACGVKRINSLFHTMHLESLEDQAELMFAVGEPVIYLANDYSKELWNGSLGKVGAISECGSPDDTSGSSISCFFDGTRHELSREDFNNLDLAYAITVHKAQGSQFQRVIIPIVKSRLLDRSLIYTALTRAVKQIVFIGDSGAFRDAVRLPPKSQERMVGFSL